MNEGAWRPLFLRSSDEPTDFDVLHEGIPEWLDGSIWRWLMDRAAEGGPGIITRLERRLHIPLAGPKDRLLGSRHTPPNELLDRYWKSRSDNECLVLIDAILFDMQARGHAAVDDDDVDTVERLIDAAQNLDRILTEGGSAWSAHIDAPTWSLTRRVDDTTAELVKIVGSPTSDAARKIKAAWQACYRATPDPDTAYREAVRAVEAVTIPVTIPNSPRASLGGVIAHIRDTLTRWSIAGLEAKEITSAQTLLDMLSTLWHNQERHARADGTIVDVSQVEAEAAVSLAVTLVHWFASGLVTRSDPE